MNFMNNCRILCVLFLASLNYVACKKYGVLAAESSSEKENFCIIIFPEFADLPEEKSQASFHILQDESHLDFCNTHPEGDFKSKVLLLTRKNCSLAEQAQVVQEQGGEAVLFVTPSGKVDHIVANATAAKYVNITVGLISENSVQRLREMKGTPTVCLFAPENSSFDFSLLILGVAAILTVAIGSYWSGLVRHYIYCRENSKLPELDIVRGSTPPCTKQHPAKKQAPEESSLNVSPQSVAIFVICMGFMLMMLYFFFEYLVYFIIGLFVFATIISMYSCLEPFFLMLPHFCCRLPELRCGSMSCAFDYRQWSVLLLSMALSISWAVLRKERCSWILQDILGISFCIHMLKSIRLPNLKICTFLLVLLFFYDIFFVFITPFLTVKGESVMEEVATGGKSQEMLPMVLKVPHFSLDPLTVCYQQFSLLGFGDILVPGLLVSYCYGFDLISVKKCLYFPLSVATYSAGLIITFFGLFFMGTAQPALLYLVPSTLLPVVFLGWCRHELSLLWVGFKVNKPSEMETNYGENAAPPANVLPTVDPPTIRERRESLPTFNNIITPEIPGAAGASHETIGECKQLLR